MKKSIARLIYHNNLHEKRYVTKAFDAILCIFTCPCI